MACPFHGEGHEDHFCEDCKHSGVLPEKDPNSKCYPCMYAFTTVPADEQTCNWEAIP